MLDEVLQHIFVSNIYFSRCLVLVYIKVRVIQFVFYVIYMSCICQLYFVSFFPTCSVYLTFTYNVCFLIQISKFSQAVTTIFEHAYKCSLNKCLIYGRHTFRSFWKSYWNNLIVKLLCPYIQKTICFL